MYQPVWYEHKLVVVEFPVLFWIVVKFVAVNLLWDYFAMQIVEYR
jgi:hypothetical protein